MFKMLVRASTAGRRWRRTAARIGYRNRSKGNRLIFFSLAEAGGLDQSMASVPINKRLQLRVDDEGKNKRRRKKRSKKKPYR